MLADLFGEAYVSTPLLLAAPVLAATTTIVVVVFACRYVAGVAQYGVRVSICFCI